MTATTPIEAVLSLTALAWGLPSRRFAGRGPGLRKRAVAIRARAIASVAVSPRWRAERARTLRSTVI